MSVGVNRGKAFVKILKQIVKYILMYILFNSISICLASNAISGDNDVPVELSQAVSSFSDCTSLKNIYYKGTEAQWCSITKYSNWEPTGSYSIIYDYQG